MTLRGKRISQNGLIYPGCPLELSEQRDHFLQDPVLSSVQMNPP